MTRYTNKLNLNFKERTLINEILLVTDNKRGKGYTNIFYLYRLFFLFLIERNNDGPLI